MIFEKYYPTSKIKRYIRKKAIKNVEERIIYQQKKVSAYTVQELRKLILSEENKILQGVGWKGAIVAIGAMFGSMMAIDNSDINHSETCYEKTYYSNQKLTKISHYNIKVRTKNRILNMKSSIPYNIHDIIYLD